LQTKWQAPVTAEGDSPLPWEERGDGLGAAAGAAREATLDGDEASSAEPAQRHVAQAPEGFLRVPPTSRRRLVQAAAPHQTIARSAMQTFSEPKTE